MTISQVGMSSKKKKIRIEFREAVLKRDNHACRKCDGNGTVWLDAHHIVDRNEISDGGYILSNGITLCEECHKKAEVYHSSNKTKYIPGYHPKDLILLIS